MYTETYENPDCEIKMGLKLPTDKEVDRTKYDFFQAQIALCFLAEKFLLETKEHHGHKVDHTTEMLFVIKEMLLMACLVPDHKLACKLFEQQGLVHLQI
jgi:hypothetical protein